MLPIWVNVRGGITHLHNSRYINEDIKANKKMGIE